MYFVMRSKIILSAAAFIVAFGFSVFLASLFISTPAVSFVTVSDHGVPNSSCLKQRYQSETALSISSLLRQDTNNGRERDRELRRVLTDRRVPFGEPNFNDYAEIVDEYVNTSESLGTSGLPVDFHNAWDEHLKAWRDYRDFLNEMKDFDRMSNSSTEKLERLENKYSTEIDQTWYKVLRVGRNHGAETH